MNAFPFFESYKSKFSDPSEIDTITKTSSDTFSFIQQRMRKKKNVDGLIFGHVQSGKTRQMLGIISLLADNQFPIFLLLTTDNINLQDQTLKRVKESLPDFCVVGEADEVKFLSCKFKKPIVLVLKKNSNILKRWRGTINTSKYCTAKPLIILDDEADSASLNTRVNQGGKSAINKHLDSIKDMASCCVYLQVTATPQAILLQSYFSGWKPDFIVYFEPGKKYLGGDFFFSEPPPFCAKFTAENELDEVREGSSFIPEGLRQSILAFLVVCAHKSSKKLTSCNFLIHPGVKKDDHAVFAQRIGEHLNLLLASFDENTVQEDLRSAWNDLKSSQPDIYNFEDSVLTIRSLLNEMKFRTIVVNSQTPYDIHIEDGFNIIIGGNCLGRGLTLPNLQVVYYCRKAKTPQADTSWQHSRMFGYDREQGLFRIFIPRTLFKLFNSLNQSNNMLVSQIRQQGLDKIQLVFPEKVKPTRRNVLDKNEVFIISGGVNFFPFSPIQENPTQLDSFLACYKEGVSHYDVTAEILLRILNTLPTPTKEDWDRDKFISCINALRGQRPNVPSKLIVRRNRDISAGTGTLLSPNDRKLGDSFTDSIVLTLYRVNGDSAKGWNGNPFWIPNIKFPDDTCYYDTKDYC